MSEPTLIVDAPPMDDIRARIVVAAAELIASGGPDAATTRAVATAAGVQVPTIYRLFGDKRGLLDAVTQDGLAAYIAKKCAREPNPDPVQELRDGWDMHIEFGLSNPGLFTIMASDPHPRLRPPSVADGLDILRRRIRNVALAGRLRVSEARAVALLQSMGTGTVLTLLGQKEERRDLGLAEVAREAVIAAITCESTTPAEAGPSGAAATLRASLDRTSVLTGGERHLLGELLDRISDGRPTQSSSEAATGSR